MSDLFGEPVQPPRRPVEPSGRSRALLITAGVLIAGFILLTTFASFWTERLWFDSVGFGSVFTRTLWTRIGLFAVFGAAMAIAVAVTIFLAHRLRPVFRPASAEQGSLDRYREAVEPIRLWLLAGISLVIGAFAGTSAAGRWRDYMLWRHGGEFGTSDPYFGRDAGYYIFDLPWQHFLVDFVMAVAVVCLMAAAVVHYLYGGIRLQGTVDRISGPAAAQLSTLMGVFVLAKGADYWLDRFDVLNGSGSLIDGMTYTDDNAVIPAKNILIGIAVICALLFFLNVWRRTWMLPSVGLGLFVLSAILLGMIWPGVVQQFQVNPSEADKEGPYIAENIKATRAAYDLEDIEVKPYEAAQTPSLGALDAATSPVPLVDPRLIRDTFEAKQQQTGYYSVDDVLDVDRYDIDGTERALVLGVRELNQNGLADSAQNWTNLHSVYTHGYGVIAAYGNQRNADNTPVPGDNDQMWAEGYLPPRGALSDVGYEPRIYFGERSPEYSIVGKREGGENVEFDLPLSPESEEGRATTYQGKAGVDLGGLWHQLLYAVKFGDANILLSSRVHENSKILYDRDPAQRVEKVAPWLSVDSDPYPAVVDGRIVWIIDGYTATDKYPLAEKDSFEEMTDDAIGRQTTFQALPTDEVNYMRNAVKATVDAYDGTVTLYEWDESDPMLQAWESAFPGTVTPKSEISEDLMAHLRYPEDLFKVQRYQFARYHVTDASDFYGSNDRWEVSQDPYATNRLQPPYRLFTDTPETAGETWSMTSTYVPYRREQNLAAFLAVNSDSSDQENYGTITALTTTTTIPSPSQVASTFANDDEVKAQIAQFSLGETEPVYGNLLTLPIDGKLLYVQPVYTLRSGDTAYPILNSVIASFGGEEVGIARTLPDALADLLGEEAPATPSTPGEPGDGGTVTPEVRRLLDQAEAAFAEADKLKRQGDFGGWADKMEEGRDLIGDAVRAADAADQAKDGAKGGNADKGSDQEEPAS